MEVSAQTSIPTQPSNLGKGLTTLGYGIRNPRQASRALVGAAAELYRERALSESPIPTVSLADMVGCEPIELMDFAGRNGNVTLAELSALCASVRRSKPATLLEIGTFDGNTTLQLALNSPEDARVFTLDLPSDPASAESTLEPDDLRYITDQVKLERKYERHPVGAKVTQWIGDSATFDFEAALGVGTPKMRAIDWAFIDGSHSYDYVRSDTERLMPLLAEDGVICWHDYRPVWPGVIAWLDEFSEQYPLRRLEGSSLVILDRRLT